MIWTAGHWQSTQDCLITFRVIYTSLKMTTWKQPEYERVMEELREQELRKRRKKGERVKKDLMVTKTMTNNPNKLTENEIHQVRQHGDGKRLLVF